MRLRLNSHFPGNNFSVIRVQIWYIYVQIWYMYVQIWYIYASITFF